MNSKSHSTGARALGLSRVASISTLLVATVASSALGAQPVPAPTPALTVKTHVDCIDALSARRELEHCRGVSWKSATFASAPKAFLLNTGPQTCEDNRSCDQHLVVRVIPAVGTQACQAAMLYDEIKIKAFAKKRKVRWQLDKAASDLGFSFKPQDEGGGMRFLTPNASSQDPNDWWTVEKTSPSQVTATVLMSPRTSEVVRACHYPRVQDSVGNLCCPIDPIIINDP